MKISKEIKIGLFAACAFAALYVGYNFLRGKRIFSNLDEYYVIYNNIDGIVKSTPVYYKGLKVGQVEKLGLIRTESANKIIATLLIDAKIRLSKSSEAKIVSQDLLGGKAISLIIPNLVDPIEEGDTIMGSEEISFSESISEMVTPVKDKTENVLVTLNKVLTEVQHVLTEGGSKSITAGINDLSGTLKNLNLATASLNQMIIQESMKFSKITGNFESISNNIKKNNESISASIINFKILSDSLANAPLKSTIEQLNKTSQQLALLTQKLNTGDGSAARLINDRQLYDNLNKSSFELQALLKDIREYPGRYVNVSVFGGGAKKAEKKKQADIKQEGN
ncbi:MAG: MlaD family protein [Bacteroidota bacterium]|nr:MlaD family protein [Bacteroidota bacterium]